MNRSLYLAIFMIAPLSFASPSFAEDQRETQRNAFMNATILELNIPGLAIAKISAGKVDYLGTYGMANTAASRPVTSETLFNIASVSKPIMGLVLLRLADQGKLNLDTDINSYLSIEIDNPHVENEHITVRHLASHTSGIADFYDETTYAINTDSPTHLEDHLKSLLLPSGENYQNGEHYLQALPGEKRLYSNLGAGLAGQIVHDVSGQSLADYSIQLFTNLGMQNTGWLLHGLDLAKIATPYEVNEEGALMAHPHYGNPQYPDGGIRTSIVDLSSFLAQLLNNQDTRGEQILSEEMLNQMFRIQFPEVSGNQRFFWRDNSLGLVGHTGSDIGVFSAMYFDPQTKNGFIILMNRGQDEETTKALRDVAFYMLEN